MGSEWMLDMGKNKGGKKLKERLWQAKHSYAASVFGTLVRSWHYKKLECRAQSDGVPIQEVTSEWTK